MSVPALILLLSGGALSFISIIVVFIGAGEEPYFGPIRTSQAIVQVGVGCVLIFCWFQWSVLAVYLSWRRYVSSLWLFAMVWAILICLYLQHGVLAYIHDLQRAWK